MKVLRGYIYYLSLIGFIIAAGSGSLTAQSFSIIGSGSSPIIDDFNIITESTSMGGLEFINPDPLRALFYRPGTSDFENRSLVFFTADTRQGRRLKGNREIIGEGGPVGGRKVRSKIYDWYFPVGFVAGGSSYQLGITTGYSSQYALERTAIIKTDDVNENSIKYKGMPVQAGLSVRLSESVTAGASFAGSFIDRQIELFTIDEEMESFSRDFSNFEYRAGISYRRGSSLFYAALQYFSFSEEDDVPDEEIGGLFRTSSTQLLPTFEWHFELNENLKLAARSGYLNSSFSVSSTTSDQYFQNYILSGWLIGGGISFTLEENNAIYLEADYLPLRRTEGEDLPESVEIDDLFKNWSVKAGSVIRLTPSVTLRSGFTFSGFNYEESRTSLFGDLIVKETKVNSQRMNLIRLTGGLTYQRSFAEFETGLRYTLSEGDREGELFAFENLPTLSASFTVRVFL